MANPHPIYKLSSGHFCFLCKKLIKKGEAATLWDYPDKKLWQHPKGLCHAKGAKQSGLKPRQYSIYR